MTVAAQFDLARVRAALPNRRIDWYETLDSTMLEAQRDPEPHRIVVADQQTAGMGRHGRQWLSPAGEGLYISIVLPTTPVPLLMLALGLATHTSIAQLRRTCHQPFPDLRWPNDVLLSQRKTAGVLATAHHTHVIAGIGINVSQSSFPPNLETPATSLALEGIETTRESLLIALIQAIDETLPLPPATILDRFTQTSTYAQGRRVQAGDVTGTTCGLDPAGFLQVREDNGTMHTILAGGVRPA